MSAAPPKSSCHAATQALVECVDASPCVQTEGRPIMDCLAAGDAPQCARERRVLTQCRRSLFDMRSRLRGAKHGEYTGEDK